MKRIAVLIVFLSLLACGTPEKEVEKVRVEFRAAQTEPGEGLIRMTIPGTVQAFYVHNEVLISNADIAWAVVSSWEGRPVVELTLTESGKEKFAQVTKENVGKRMGILVNGELLLVPVIQAPILNGKAVIDGKFTEEEAERIATGILSR